MPAMALGMVASTMLVKVSAGPNNGALNNVARISSDTPDPDNSNNRDVVTTTVDR